MSFEMFVKPLLLALLCFHINEAVPIQSQKLVDLNNRLALNLLQTLSNEDNTVFSPLSLSTSLLGLINVANGQTNQELRKMLDIHENEEISDLNSELKTILNDLNEKNSKELNLRLLSRILINSEKEEKKDLKKVLKDLKTDLDFVDFQKDSKLITKDLNEWVKDETDDRIPRLVRDNLDQSTSMLLANVAYFSGKWKRAAKSVEKRNFHNFMSYLMPGLPTSIDFMTFEDNLRSKSVPELKSQLIELPFYENNLSMIIILPESESDLQFLNENMTSNELKSALNDLKAVPLSPLKVVLPKFKLDMDYDLREPLEEDFEVKSLFQKADLKTSSGDLKMTTAIHRAVIDVDEEGEEKSEIKADKEIEVNKPFVFIVCSENLIVFMGRVQSLVNEELLGLGFI